MQPVAGLAEKRELLCASVGLTAQTTSDVHQVSDDQCKRGKTRILQQLNPPPRVFRLHQELLHFAGSCQLFLQLSVFVLSGSVCGLERLLTTTNLKISHTQCFSLQMSVLLSDSFCLIHLTPEQN